jgi:hypothetical protein
MAFAQTIKAALKVVAKQSVRVGFGRRLGERDVTSCVPSAARLTLRLISSFATLCCSTAEAIEDEIAEIRSIVAPISLTPSTDSW